MMKLVEGIVHGKTIEVAEDLGIPDGQKVELIVKTPGGTAAAGEGLLRSAGPLPDDSPKDDQILLEIEKSRKSARLRELPE